MGKDRLQFALISTLIVVGIVGGIFFLLTPTYRVLYDSGQTVWPQPGRSLADLWTDTHGVQLSTEGQDLRIVGGFDPYLDGKQELQLENSAYVLKIVIQEPEETALQVYFLRTYNRSATDSDSTRIPVKPGWNTLYVGIPEGRRLVGFRLDPGDPAGLYILRELSLRKVPRYVFSFRI